jgi:hypothetical protein
MTAKDDRAWKDYSQHFRREVVPKLLDSAVFMSIGTEVGVFDVKQATEVGAALMMDKPIMIVVPKGRRIGERLRRAADIVIDNWEPNDPASQLEMTAALHRLVPDQT